MGTDPNKGIARNIIFRADGGNIAGITAHHRFIMP